MVLATLLAGVALAGSAEPVCHGQLAPPTKAEQRRAALEHYVVTRAEFGFRSDPAYVRELIRRDMWEYDVGDFPATPRENRYLRLRDRIELGRRASRYLRARPDLSGGISVEDDWPRGPYLLVRLTRDRALHEARLRRLARFPDNLRTVEVEHSERELRRIQNRIDFEPVDGFQITGAGVDIDLNRVVIELITARTDHAQYFAARYGPLVVTEVIATEPTSLECSKTDYYEVARDGRGLTVHWTTGGGAELERVELVEHGDRVEVGVVERVPNGPRTLEARAAEHFVPLTAPLGEREVIDAATGRRLLQHGPSPGEPACPTSPRYSRLDEFIRSRQERGLPHRRAFVRRMLRRRNPYTRRESRYLRVRQALEYHERVDGYLERHRDEWGGSTIEDRFPARPRLVIRFTRRPAFHEARLKRLAPYPELLRTKRSAHSVAELEALVERISDDASAGGRFLDGYGDAGFFVEHVWWEDGVVTVRLRTPRRDHAAYFRRRYGSAVRTVVAGTRFECRDVLF